MSALLAIKRLICALGFGDRLVEFCDACGRETDLVWLAPDDLWADITGETTGGGAYCTRCFGQACDARGLILRWRPEIAHLRKQAANRSSSVDGGGR